jgi:hypothetical protein
MLERSSLNAGVLAFIRAVRKLSTIISLSGPVVYISAQHLDVRFS